MSLTVEKCLQAWTNSLRQMNAKADIVFFGDSLTYYGDFSSVFPDKIVCNLGLRGDTILGMMKRVEQVKLLNPKKVFLMAGINDIAFCEPGKFSELYEALILKLKEEIPKTELFIHSLLPVNDIDYKISCQKEQITDANKTIRRLADIYYLQYIDIYSAYQKKGLLPREETIDGIHLLPSSYNKWNNALSRI